MTFCPTTPSLRFIQKLAPLPVKPKLRKLSQCITVAQGRSKGQIVLRHRGGLCKSRFPLVLKDRSSFFFPTYIVNFIKTSSSKPFVALIKNPQGVLSYISIPHGLGVGTFLYTAIGQSLTTIKATGVFT